jgi:hypothetical protein
MEIIVKATDIVGFETFMSSESFLVLAIVIKEKNRFWNTKSEN